MCCRHGAVIERVLCLSHLYLKQLISVAVMFVTCTFLCVTSHSVHLLRLLSLCKNTPVSWIGDKTVFHWDMTVTSPWPDHPLPLCNHCSVFICHSWCICCTSISGMQLYSWKEVRTILAVFIRRPCSDNTRMQPTAARSHNLLGWASWGPYCEQKLMMLLWST